MARKGKDRITVAKGHNNEIHGDGGVEDYCWAIDFILHKGCVGDMYNISAYHWMRIIKIVKLFRKELGKPESLIALVEDCKGHDFSYIEDSSKIRNELGWKPVNEFDREIVKTIHWYCENMFI